VPTLVGWLGLAQHKIDPDPDATKIEYQRYQQIQANPMQQVIKF
jgi:hypothetical protein